MFTLLSGPFHPFLETALVETIQQSKAADPLTPLAIIVPSESLRRRVQWVLCAEHSCALIDVHFLTFHQFALHLAKERQAVNSPDLQEGPLTLVGDFFYEFLLSVVVEKGGQSVQPFAHKGISSGLRQALWRSLRDLQEAQVEPELALRGVDEGVFDVIATERLRGIFHLQAALMTLSRQLKVGLPEDLTQSVIHWVQNSPFIKKCSKILYYGFYDLTQVQLSFLEEVARVKTVTIFFPLADQPAYQFAQRFLDRHLLKAGVVHHVLPANHGSSHGQHQTGSSPEIQVVSVFGEQGELSFTSKAILQAVELTGQRYADIGVVARNLEPYVPYLRRIFGEHRIPFFTTATASLLEEPAAKVWWQLAGLKEEQYLWRSLLDIVTSPYCRALTDQGLPLRDQGHCWRYAVRYLRIVRGQEDWERLKTASTSPAFFRDWQRKTGMAPEAASAAMEHFVAVVDRLISDCEALPESGSISELTNAFDGLAKKYLSLEDGLIADHMNGRDDARLTNLVQGLDQSLHVLRQLDCIGTHLTWEAWVREFRRALELIHVPLSGQSPLGVRVLDAMGARGQTFSTLFLLGMNDKVFPRVVREDAFVRDRDRLVLSASLGYKIDEKLQGFEEESLLYALLRQSTRDKVYCVYQRADNQGRPLLLSSLLMEKMRDEKGEPNPEIHVPLRMTERAMIPFYAPRGETLQETCLGALLQAKSIQPDSPDCPEWWEIFQNGFKAVSLLEQSLSGAGPFDGIMAGEAVFWQEYISRGISPTALETYAQCPFRFWIEQILSARDDREPFSRELPGRVWGELGHALLRRVYQHLVDRDWPASLIETSQLSSLLTASIEQVFEEYAAQYGKGYVLVWERMKKQFFSVAWTMVEHDQQEYADRGFLPEAFEVDAEGEVPEETPAQASLIRIRGRLDRVDRQGADSRVRIVDYKFSSGLRLPADEPDLLGEALKGRRLQPPIYSLMSSFSRSRPAGTIDGETALFPSAIQSVEFRFIRPSNPEPLGFSSFSSSTWEGSTGRQLLRTIHRWIEGIRAGQFFVLPGSYCRGCYGSAVCRSQHHPTWVRAYGFPLAKEFRKLRKQRAIHE